MRTTLLFILIFLFYFILFWSVERSGPIWACHNPSHCCGKNTVSLPEVGTRCYLTQSGYETNIRNISSDTFIFPVAWPPTDHSCRYDGPTQSRRTQRGERRIWPYQSALARRNPLMLQSEVVKAQDLCVCVCISACLKNIAFRLYAHKCVCVCCIM